MLINDSKGNGLTVPRVFKSVTLVSGSVREFLLLQILGNWRSNSM